MKKQFLEAGKIVATLGLKGDVKVDPWCNNGKFLCSFSEIFLKNGFEKIKVIYSRVQKNVVILHLDGIDTIEDARKLCGQVIYINRNDSKLQENEYFIEDLLGADVINADNEKHYGKLSDVLKTGANDVYEITANNGEKYLVPVIPDVIKAIDIYNEIIKIIPLRGIFDDEN